MFASPGFGAEDKPYDATYQHQDYVSGHWVSFISRSASDGKGHYYTERITGGSKSIELIDQPNHVTYLIDDAKHEAIKFPMDSSKLSAQQQNNITAASERIAAYNATVKARSKPLGEKMIAGHRCHGYQWTDRGTVWQRWDADDVQGYVRMESKSPSRPGVTELKSYSTNPSEDLFRLPANYRVRGLSIDDLKGFGPG